jgi:hypothetical protein
MAVADHQRRTAADARGDDSEHHDLRHGRPAERIHRLKFPGFAAAEEHTPRRRGRAEIKYASRSAVSCIALLNTGYLPPPAGGRPPMAGGGVMAVTIRPYFPGHLPRDGPVTFSLQSLIPGNRNWLLRDGICRQCGPRLLRGGIGGRGSA